MEQGAQQPDFSQVAHSFRDAADHFERCGNLPAVDGGVHLIQRMDAILEELAALRQTIQRRFDEVDRRIEDLDRRVDGLDQKITGTGTQ